jgi:hypothetical protein
LVDVDDWIVERNNSSCRFCAVEEDECDVSSNEIVQDNIVELGLTFTCDMNKEGGFIGKEVMKSELKAKFFIFHPLGCSKIERNGNSQSAFSPNISG